MSVRVERTETFDATPEQVWAFISDPENRASAISVVADYRVDPADPTRCTWDVELPIPLLSRTATVETHDRIRDPPKLVEFTGRSSVLDVTGRHEIRETEGGTELLSRFDVDGRLPGVERYFTRTLDDELDNLRRLAEQSFENDRVDD